MWSPSRPKILAFKYRLTQVGKKGNFLRIKSDFIVSLSHGKIRSAPTWSLEGVASSAAPSSQRAPCGNYATMVPESGRNSSALLAGRPQAHLG